MANGQEHKVSGGASALVAEWLVPNDIAVSDEDRLKVRAVATLAGVIGGMFPDAIEPALHPNHRSHFHSWLAVGALCWALYEVSRRRPASMHERYAIAAGRGFFVGYLSHLALDSTTSKSLPLV